MATIIGNLASVSANMVTITGDAYGWFWYNLLLFQMNRVPPMQRLVLPNQMQTGPGLSAPNDPRSRMWRSEPNIHFAATQRPIPQQHPGPGGGGPNVGSVAVNHPTSPNACSNWSNPSFEQNNFDAIVSMSQYQSPQINFQNSFQQQPSRLQGGTNPGSVVSFNGHPLFKYI